jgi:hypothetical protein
MNNELQKTLISDIQPQPPVAYLPTDMVELADGSTVQYMEMPYQGFDGKWYRDESEFEESEFYADLTTELENEVERLLEAYGEEQQQYESENIDFDWLDSGEENRLIQESVAAHFELTDSAIEKIADNFVGCCDVVNYCNGDQIEVASYGSSELELQIERQMVIDSVINYNTDWIDSSDVETITNKRLSEFVESKIDGILADQLSSYDRKHGYGYFYHYIGHEPIAYLVLAKSDIKEYIEEEVLEVDSIDWDKWNNELIIRPIDSLLAGNCLTGTIEFMEAIGLNLGTFNEFMGIRFTLGQLIEKLKCARNIFADDVEKKCLITTIEYANEIQCSGKYIESTDIEPMKKVYKYFGGNNG